MKNARLLLLGLVLLAMACAPSSPSVDSDAGAQLEAAAVSADVGTRPARELPEDAAITLAPAGSTITLVPIGPLTPWPPVAPDAGVGKRGAGYPPVPPPGVAGTYLRSNGTTVLPSWVSISSGDLPTLAGDVTGSVTSNKVVNLTGSSGLVTVSSGTSLAFGTNPAQSGLLRTPNNTIAVAARNAANTADLNLLQSTSGNVVQLGDSTQFAGANIFGGNSANFISITPTSVQASSNANIYLSTPTLNIRDGSAAQVITGTLNGSGATTLQVAGGVTSFTLNQATPLLDFPTAAWNIQAQSAFASATTNKTGANLVLQAGAGATTNGSSGNVIAKLNTPSGTGSFGSFQVQDGSTSVGFLGRNPTGGTQGWFWLGQITPGATNYSIVSDGATFTAFNTGGGYLTYRVANATGQLSVNGSGVQLGSETFTLGGGTGVVGWANASVAPTSLPSANNILAWASAGDTLNLLGSDANSIALQLKSSNNLNINPAASGSGVAGSGLTVAGGVAGSGGLSGGALSLFGGAPSGAVTTSVVNLGPNTGATMTIGDQGWQPANTNVTIAASGTTTLTQGQYKFPVIIANAVTSTSAVVKFPAVNGIWYFDINAVTISGSFSVQCGTSGAVALTAPSPTTNVITVLCESNTIRVNQ